MSELIIAGVDEAGVGPLAGPVYAAAVILNPRKKIYKIRDSKILTATQRDILFDKIQERALAISIGRAEVEEIDRLNIFHANMLAMERAIAGLSIKPNLILIDGRSKPNLEIEIRTIVKGDQTETVISAASIIAKVTRDREMERLHAKYPIYNFAKHKGYATKEHRTLLKRHGPCELHRKSFITPRKIYVMALALYFCEWLLSQ